MTRKVEVSHRTIVFTVLFLLLLGFLYIVRELILQLFVALLLMTILGPLVNKLAAAKVPRALAVLVAYILFVGVLGGVIASITPVVIDQTTKFITALPGYLTNIGVTKELSDKALEGFLTTVGDIPGEVFKLTYSIFSN